MKSIFILAAAAMACGAVLAQAPAGVVKTPSNQTDPNASGGKAQAKGAMNADAKTGGMTATAGATATMGNNAMDRNGDGMISRKEWNDHHNKMWGGMKANKQGMVPWSDVESGMKGTPK